MTRVMICHSFAPSTRAASARSSGIDRKNCRSKKIENASPKKLGTINGLSDGTQWNTFTKTTYSGSAVTWKGNISVAKTRTNTTWRPRHFIRDNAYATGIDESTTPIVVRNATVIVLN